MKETADLVVVGAGPAGMHAAQQFAALAAGRTGAGVVVIDGYPRPGGQYFKQLPASFHSEGGAAPAARHRAELESVLAEMDKLQVRILSNTLVWGAFAGDRPQSDGEGRSSTTASSMSASWLLAVHGPEALSRLETKALILATGAYDRPVPFPGWTLPGVMTAGAVQTLIKSQRVLPGRRFLLSGAGPLQFAVAAALVDSGAEVAGVLEGSVRGGLASLGQTALRDARAIWGQWARVSEGWNYLRTLRRAQAPIRLGWAVVEAHGDGQVEEAVIAQLDPTWRPIPGTAETVTVDTIVIGYGFMPSTELGRLLGCAHEFRPEQGGYVPRRDAQMQTTLAGVYAVGDGAGIGGAELSKVEGQIAGIAAARQLGYITEANARSLIAQLHPRLQRERRFAAMLGRLFTPGPGLYGLAQDETIICRCEEVTLGQIRAAVADGVRSANELKGLTRTGMGNCQGRICGELAARYLAREARPDAEGDESVALEAVGMFTARPPIHPLPLSVLAAAATPDP